MERFECETCFHTGPLDQHGRCERCGSSQVVSEQVLSYILDKKYEKLFGERPSQLGIQIS